MINNSVRIKLLLVMVATAFVYSCINRFDDGKKTGSWQADTSGGHSILVLIMRHRIQSLQNWILMSDLMERASQKGQAALRMVKKFILQSARHVTEQVLSHCRQSLQAVHSLTILHRAFPTQNLKQSVVTGHTQQHCMITSGGQCHSTLRVH